MGFARYWRQPQGISAEAFANIVADTRVLLAAVRIPLEVGCISDEEISFDGRGAKGCESLILTRAASDFECVKTMRRPYDVVVAAVLAIAKHHAPTEMLEISSDQHPLAKHDDWEAYWQPAIELCRRAGLIFPPESLARLRADIEYRKDFEGAPPPTAPAPRLATGTPTPAASGGQRLWLVALVIVITVAVALLALNH